MPYNEADTRANLIEPKLKAAGWTDKQVTREYFYQRNVEYTLGKIFLVGDQVKRGKPKRVDYILRLTESFPIAIVEAKAETESALSGLEQAKRYAKDLGLYFAYATNGHEIIEYDFFAKTSRTLFQFPRPEELWERWQRNMGLETLKTTGTTFKIGEPTFVYEFFYKTDPLLYPYCSIQGKQPRYYQEVAIREVIVRIMRGQKRILLALATGTGKTYIAFQIVWKLLKSKWLEKNIQDDLHVCYF